MQRTEYKSLGDILRATIEECRMAGRLDELKACDVWSRIVGERIAAITGRPKVRDGIMTVASPNASLRQELMMRRGSLIRIINSELGKRVITEIRFCSSM